MTATKENRTKILPIRLKPEELILLEKRFKKTRFHTLSEYVRCVLFEKPVTVLYRDKSMDDLLEELALLRQELNAIGNNLNQSVHSLHATRDKPDIRLWLKLLEVIDNKLGPAIEDIRVQMNKVSDIWSQKLKADKT